MSELARDLTNTVFFFTCVCVCLEGTQLHVVNQTTARWTKASQTNPRGAAGSLLLPTAWEVIWKAAQQQGTGCCPQQWLECAEVAGSWQCSGKGLQQGVCTVQGTTAWRGSDKAAIISPCRATLTHCSCAQRAPFTWRARLGGPRWGNTFDTLVLPLQKNHWCCLACHCNVTIEMSASCKSAFCFPQRKQAAFSLVPVSSPRTHWSVLELTEAFSEGQALSPVPQLTRLMLGRDSHTHLCPLDAPGEGFGGSRDQLWAHWNLEFQFLTHQACKTKPFPPSLL